MLESCGEQSWLRYEQYNPSMVKETFYVWAGIALYGFRVFTRYFLIIIK